MTIYPKIPGLNVLVGGVRLSLKPILSSNPDPELRVQVRAGLTGDVVTHGYYIGLHDEIGRHKLELTERDLNHITRMYFQRIRTRLELEAILRGSNLWWTTIYLKLCPNVENFVIRNVTSEWEKMAAGHIPDDELYIEIIRGEDGFLAYRQDHYVTALSDVVDGDKVNN
ncbi:hypothetical protein LUCX_63 [Xanthomonas phage vB_XciM_LucasX]|nr:hypothetical protein LUCX_63 [Xanthomonas phage vB_XciM_LucasX]